MNVGQFGLVPTGRKQLANLRGGGFTGASGARGRRGRAPRDGKARTRGPRPRPPPPASPDPRGARPSHSCHAKFRCNRRAPRNQPPARNLGTGEGAGLRDSRALPRLSPATCFFGARGGESSAPTTPPTPTPYPAPCSASWDDLGKGDCGGIGLKDWRLFEGKLPWWVASRLAAPSSGEVNL